MQEIIDITRNALQLALEAGAQKARVTFCRSVENLVATLDGEVDKVTRCEDNSLSFALFADGRFGSFSTNRLDSESLRPFLAKAVLIVRMMAQDPCRDLPAPEHCCRTAVSGNELDLLDPAYTSVTEAMRRQFALEASVFGADTDVYKIISEEGEYSDSIYETVLLDSNGLCCVHAENSFDYGVEITIESGGGKYSGYWWDSSSRLGKLMLRECGVKALERAAGQIGAEPVESRRCAMVVDSDVASKIVTPILNALNGYSIQQKNSFLEGSLGKTLFPEGLTIVDRPHIKGQTCSKLFDSEGVATVEAPIIEKGCIKQYFINTYMSGKMGFEPTVEDPTRPAVMPWPRRGLKVGDLMELGGDGIYVTDFNGGNCNTSTGDFSYGVEGFLFEGGRIVSPVSGMVVTGNFMQLWSSLLAIADDARPCMTRLIPSIAFRDVDFSGE